MNSSAYHIVFLRVLLFPLAMFRLVVVFLISVAFLFLSIAEYYLSQLFGKNHFITMRLWGWCMLIVLGVVVRRNKFPSVDRFILMPNHRSYIDIFLVAAHKPTTFVAKAELRKWPVLGFAMSVNRMIFVQRDNLRSMFDTMSQIKQAFDNGLSVTVFPEGTTFKGPGLRPFKAGSFKMAAEAGVPLVPAAIEYRNRNDAWVGNDTFIAHFFRQMWKPLTFVNFTFGEKIINEDFKELKEQTRESIEKLLDKSV
jgi:1-acyl-sn-glycerol-3-phosphate acyltransferase